MGKEESEFQEGEKYQGLGVSGYLHLALLEAIAEANISTEEDWEKFVNQDEAESTDDPVTDS
jgi:hypothetical protein